MIRYISQMNGFWGWLKVNSISAREAFLYFAILDCANSCHWKPQFTIPNSILQGVCQLSKCDLHLYRSRLKEKGLITYQNGNHGNAGVYSVIPLYDTFLNTHNDTENNTNPQTETHTEIPTILKSKSKSTDKEKEKDVNNLSPKVPLPSKINHTEELFNTVWSIFPKKVKRKDALNAFEKLNPNEDLTNQIISAIRQQATTDQWRKENGKYIPLLTTYLHGERWKDEGVVQYVVTPDDPRYIP